MYDPHQPPFPAPSLNLSARIFVSPLPHAPTPDPPPLKKTKIELIDQLIVISFPFR